MARLFAKKFDIDSLPAPKKPKEDIEQGSSVINKDISKDLITNPNTSLNKIEPGDRIVDPKTQVNEIKQGDQITNPNTQVDKIKQGDRIVDPRIETTPTPPPSIDLARLPVIPKPDVKIEQGSTTVYAKDIEPLSLLNQRVTQKLLEVQSRIGDISSREEILESQGASRGAAASYVSFVKTVKFGTNEVEQGSALIKPLKDIPKGTSPFILTKVKSDLITDPFTKVQKVSQDEFIVDPNTPIRLVKADELITNPNTVINLVDQNEFIINPNTVVTRVKDNELIVNPNTPVKLVDQNEFIINPNTTIRLVKADELIVNPNTKIQLVDPNEFIVNPNTIIRLVDQNEFIINPQIITTKVKDIDITRSQPDNVNGLGVTRLFPRTISLKDRFKQALVGSTRHLAEFFLSDLATGYITIKSPKVIEKISLVNVQKKQFNDTILQQGGLITLYRTIESFVSPDTSYGDKQVLRLPNITIKQIEPGDRTVNPNTQIDPVNPDEMIVDPNTVVRKVNPNEMIVDPNVVVKKVNPNELIVNPNTPTRQVDPNEKIVNPNTPVIPVTLDELIVNPNTPINLVNPNEMIVDPGVEVKLVDPNEMIVDPNIRVKLVDPNEMIVDPNVQVDLVDPNEMIVDPNIQVRPVNPNEQIVNPETPIRLVDPNEMIVDPDIQVTLVNPNELIVNPNTPVNLVDPNEMIVDPNTPITLVDPNEMIVDPNTPINPVNPNELIFDPRTPINPVDPNELIVDPNTPINPVDPNEMIVDPRTPIRLVDPNEMIVNPNVRISLVNPNELIFDPQVIIRPVNPNELIFDPGVVVRLVNPNELIFDPNTPVIPVNPNELIVDPGIEVIPVNPNELIVIPDETYYNSSISNNKYNDTNSYTREKNSGTESPMYQAGQTGFYQIRNNIVGGVEIVDRFIDRDWTANNGDPNLPGGYTTLNYKQIQRKASDRGDAQKDFTIELGLNKNPIRNYQERIQMPDKGSDMMHGQVTQKIDQSPAINDFVRVAISSPRDGVSLQFRSFITAFSDSFTPSYTDVNFIGRPDTMKVYKGVSRTISLGLKVPILSEEDLLNVYKKLEALIKVGVMGKVTDGNNYLRGPFLRLTVGSWLSKTPIILNTLKFDTNPTEYSWDISKEVPHIVDVSMDCIVLADNTGAGLTSAGTYITRGAFDLPANEQ